jgi:DNA polymerase
MAKVYIDFETRSDINIKKAGSYKYMESPYFEPLCMAYAIDDEPVNLWIPTQPVGIPDVFPTRLLSDNTISAFNIEFEMNVLNHSWLRWNECFKDEQPDFTPHDFIDVQAVARLFGFPAKLEELAKVLNVAHQKSAAGTRLINLLCVTKPGVRPPTPQTNKAEFLDLYEYCKQDVRTTRACHKALIKNDLSESEKDVFAHMLKQNQTGFPIDIESVKEIIGVMEEYKNKANSKLYELTNGRVSKGTQVQRITNYIRGQGHGIPDLAAPTITEILDRKMFDSKTREILRCRQAVSHSSTAKFNRMIEMLCKDGRIKGNLKYYGGHTGRFAGVGVQLHNLPRAQHEDPEEVLRHFKEWQLHGLMEEYGNLGSAASKLIRPMIKAEEGKVLYVADYVSVENVVLHWTANDMRTTEDFANKIDQYKRYASRRFNVPYEEVNKDQRTYAKPCVLGLGYGGGAGALQRVAGNYGIVLSDQAAEKDKKFYRSTYPEIPDLWYTVQNFLIKATLEKSLLELHTGTTTLKFIGRDEYSFILLPSDRFLAYPLPQIQRDAQYENQCFTYMGIDGTTKQWRRLGDQHRILKDGTHAPDMPVHGGRLVENIIQALARDLLVYGMLKAEHAGFGCIGSVHDESIAEEPTLPAVETLNKFEAYCKALCTLPEWARGLPIRADGYVGKRYRKD